ncbi:hypothetical protein [Fontivita pretiosa]|uniref:hypothetical protein n=1 Tax=Fontivita pretiosa TaxID=2989684 RepID=UPI003D16C757
MIRPARNHLDLKRRGRPGGKRIHLFVRRPGLRVLVSLLGIVPLCLIVAASVLLHGCATGGSGAAASGNARAPTSLQPLDLNNPVTPATHDGPVKLAAAKNEWTSFQLQLSGLPPANDKTAYTLRIQPLNLQTANRTIEVRHFTAYQIISMPVDLNRAGFVRHTGLSAATRMMPRALLPLPINEGRINLSAARDPNNPTDPGSRAGTAPLMLWIDLHVPPEAPAGNYASVCEVLKTGQQKPIASVAVNLTVYDFVLPDERHLHLVGQIEWESLTRLYANRFEAVTPKLINRTDPRYAAAVKTLDQLVALAQAHRVQVVVPRLQPSVKWPAGRPPTVDWRDFDELVGPWLKGDIFPDKVPLGYWPLPADEKLSNYDPKSQQDYWSEAATHFDQNDWLARSPVFIDKPTPGRAGTHEAIKLSADAALVLNAHPRVRVAVPLEDDQVQFANPGNPNLVPTNAATRLLTANPGVVFSSPIQNWPAALPRPQRWLRTDLTGLIPYVGAGGDERDVRLWAWLSFLPLPPPPMGVQYGPVQFIRWVGVLPKDNSPTDPADPNELIWFYPGSWFGLDEPVPTVQLKWLRRAQQDFEYLYLARLRGDLINALFMARLMTKPVQLQPNQPPDPTYGLMSGTADPKAWDQAIDLLARRILLREPGQELNKDLDFRLNIETLQWSQPQERPVIMGRSTRWSWDDTAGQRWIKLWLGIDVYNASDSTPDENSLAWTNLPPNCGWQVRPQPRPIEALATYQVRRFAIEGLLDPTRLSKITPQPIEVTFTHGFTKKTSQVRMMLPVSITDRREGMLELNGALDDWSPEDAIQNGPLVRMFNRPAIQSGQLQFASTPTEIYTAWADENFYVAFKVGGISQSPVRVVRNFVNYQVRRAWGEDLTEILIQPLYADGSSGALMHVVCKPTGHWVEKGVDPRINPERWQAFEGTGVRYAATIDGPDWRAEVAIPWRAMAAESARDLPVMLRFNFTHHRHDTGESASWAGPIDFGRDDAFTGILLLREPDVPGLARP